MLPTVVLVGRPNVGKSTLFNRLTRSRDALVADLPGLTRDRHYGRGRVGDRPYLVVDTGGLEPVAKEGIMFEMAKQSRQAVDEADVVMFLVDGRAGCTPQDAIIAEQLRKTGKPILLLVNKAEGMAHAKVTADFFELGLGEPLPISSAHGDNVNEVIEIALEKFPPETEEEANHEHPPKLAIVGRPNVGKSTLVNAILGEQRVIAFDQPGTTRDSIYIDFERDGKRYTIIDTAGVRRRGKVEEAVEKFSVIKTMQAIEDANVVVLVVDARDQITEQDAHVADYVLEAGRALVLAVNKWDGLDEHHRDQVKRDIERKLHFLSFAKLHFISALHANGIRGRAEIGGRSLCGGDGETVHAQANPRADRRAGKAAAAQIRALHTEDALCPPGRQQSAADRDPRQRRWTTCRPAIAAIWSAPSARYSS